MLHAGDYGALSRGAARNRWMQTRPGQHPVVRRTRPRHCGAAQQSNHVIGQSRDFYARYVPAVSFL
jgi:hypothetical protein